MKAWFERLQPRERLVLGAGLAAALLLLVYAVIWSPLRNGSLELRDTVAEKGRLIADLRRAESLGSDGATRVATAANESLLVLVENTAQSAGLAGSFTRTRPDGSDAINITFQNASFDGLVGWLVMLETTHGIVVERASVTGSRERGLVTGQLFLRRA